MSVSSRSILKDCTGTLASSTSGFHTIPVTQRAWASMPPSGHVDQPLANFQIGLPSAWITPDNSDNKDKPLAPEGTLARKWAGTRANVGQRLSDGGRRSWLLGRQSLPLRSAEIQHECHATVL